MTGQVVSGREIYHRFNIGTCWFFFFRYAMNTTTTPHIDLITIPHLDTLTTIHGSIPTIPSDVRRPLTTSNCGISSFGYPPPVHLFRGRRTNK